MRNLIEFPLTPTEVLEALDKAIEDRAAKGYVGDIDIHALYSIRAHFLARKWVLDDICDQAKRELLSPRNG